jgi:hypothetical protein
VKVGYTKAYRKELESDIWKMPPLYQRVFFYLRQTAVWQPETFPTRQKYKIALNPGQLITSFAIIADGVSWYEYGIKKTPNKKTIKDILTWLESNSMVTVVSNRYGTFITIINWNSYNEPNNEKVTPSNQQKVTPKKRQLDTLKEDKEDKEIKKKEKTILPDWLPLDLWDEFKKYRTKIKKPLGIKAVELNLAKLEKLKLAGNDPQAVIEQTIERGWQGFFPIKEQEFNPNTGSRQTDANLRAAKAFLERDENE